MPSPGSHAADNTIAWSPGRRVLAGLVGALIAAVITVIVLSFVTGEKRVQNNRTHRKLLIVDGELGFTGAVGIADNCNRDATSPDHWRDSHS
jgi:phosphatidylserine/phosphatidylglycerophosphate/cardiolipin synthase-like enzyme